MPEGPKIAVLKELAEPFSRQVVASVAGNFKDKNKLVGQKILGFKTWGKHFLICFKGFTVRVHLMLFGSYLINEESGKTPTLGLTFKKGTLNFYASKIIILEGDLDDIYDWSTDVMSEDWDPKAAKAKLKAIPNTPLYDVLFDQDIFSGVGNIIKNEVLFRTKIHPATKVGDLPTDKLNELLKDLRTYSFEFQAWFRNDELKKHWQAYKQKTCPRDKNPFKEERMGKQKRRTFFCEKCQVFY